MAEYAAIAAAVVAVASASIATYQGVQQAEYQSDVAKAQRRQARVDEKNALEGAAFEERQRRRELRLIQGQQLAIYAASGVDPSSGSPLFNMLDTVRQSEIEALRIRALGSQEAQRHSFAGRLYSFQSRSARAQIPWIIAGGTLQAVSSGASAGISTYYGIKGYQGGKPPAQPKQTSSVVGRWYS
jgi:hypothetical protein